MGRPLRIEYAGALYHVFARGNEKKKLFRDDFDKIKFIKILKDYHDRHGVLFHCYALINNHYHLVIETPLANLSKIMHGINSGYTGYFNRKYDRSGHLFQGRYKAILIDKDIYLIHLSKYVHLNPVKTHLAQKPEEYKWSSYPGFIYKHQEIKWVEYSWILSQFDHRKEKARIKYKDFIDENKSEKSGNIFENLYGQIILGSDNFVKDIKKFLKKSTISDEIIERKRLRDYIKPHKIIREVKKEFHVKKEDLIGRGSYDNQARKTAIYLIKRYCGLSNQEVGRLFGGIHYSAVSKVSSRLEKEMGEDKSLSRKVETILSNVKT